MDETIEIPGYKIERHIGSGATATVYLAEQINLQRKVAIKLMTTSLIAEGSFRERFMREGRVVAQLNHPNIVTVIDINEYNSNYYMVMEYVDGGVTLKEKIQDGIEVDEAVSVICQIGEALGYAHKRKFVHRDVKPANILFRADGTPVLSDFGITRVVGEGTQLTQEGYTVGTPAYMSPEQVLGKDIDTRSDIYSLGVVFYETLTGDAPFRAQETFALAMQHVNETPPLLPESLAIYQPVLDKSLAKEPDNRYPTTEAMIQAIKEAYSGVATTADVTLMAPKTIPTQAIEHEPLVNKTVDIEPPPSAPAPAAIPASSSSAAASPSPAPSSSASTSRPSLTPWLWTIGTVLGLLTLIWLLVMLDQKSAAPPDSGDVISSFIHNLAMQGELHWYWWILGLIFMVFEILLPGIFFLWLGVSAGVIGGVLLFTPTISWQTQFLLFGILSIASTIIWHALWHNKQIHSDQPVLNRRGQQCVGRIVTLQEPVIDGWGKVKIDGLSWKARGEDLPSGTKIKVVGVDGATLMIEPVNPISSRQRN